MGGESSSTQQQVTSRAPTIGGSQLQGILGNLGNISPNLTGAQTGALDTLSANAQQGNQFAPGIAANANQMLGGGPQVLRDTLSGKFLDPNSNPFYSQLSNDAVSRAMEQINLAGAGNGGATGSGSYGLQVGKGVSSALAPIFASMYGQERGNQMQGLGFDLANRQQGLGFADAAKTAENYGPLAQLNIESQRTGIPLAILAAQAGIVLPAANAFATQTGNTTGTQQMSGADQFKTIAQGFGSILPKVSLTGTLPGMG